MAEEWRTIPSAPDYEASSHGAVRRRVAGRFLPAGAHLTQTDCHGYRVVGLRVNRQHRTGMVHALVLEAFIGPRPSRLHVVAHADGSRDNNRVENLRWATMRENEADKRQHGTAGLGEQNSQSKLTAQQVRDIREAAAAGVKQVAIAAHYGVSAPAICKIVAGEVWSHV